MDEELKILIEEEINVKYKLSDEHIFIINGWINSLDKEKILVRCIKRLKHFNIPILLISSGDRPNNLGKIIGIRQEIQKLVDYFIFINENEVLPFEKIKELNIDSLRFVGTNNLIIHSYCDFHHDFAVLSCLKTAILFSSSLGKTKIHYLEYDNLINVDQYYQTFLNEINYNDSVLYEYERGSINRGFCAFFIFSMKIDLALKITTEITSLEEHFKNSDWRAENFLLNKVAKYTNNFIISKYIDTDRGLNICYLWNRELLKGFVFYIVVDNFENLYVMSKSDENYLIEIIYGNYKRFNNLKGYQLIEIGRYEKDASVIFKYIGQVFYEKVLSEDFDKYREKNYIWIRN